MSETLKNQNEILLKYKKAIVMFDSNGLHRGIYERNNKDRIVLQMQFLDIQKVYQLGFKKRLNYLCIKIQNQSFVIKRKRKVINR